MKSVSPEFAAALRARFKRIAYLVSLDWPSGPLYFSTWSAPLIWQDATYLSAGKIATLDLPGGGRSSQTRTAKVGLKLLPGIPDGALGANIRNRSARIDFALLNDSGHVIGAVPMIIGVMSARRAPARLEGEAVTYSVEIDIWDGGSPRKPGSGRHTYEDQLARTNGVDTAGRHLSAIEGTVLVWPE